MEPGAVPVRRTSPRLVGFLGRVGEGVKVRGMFVHPRELAAALGSEPSVGRYQAVVTEGPDGRDVLAVRIEAAPGCALGAAELGRLGARIRDAVKVRAGVEGVAAGTIAADAPPLVDARS